MGHVVYIHTVLPVVNDIIQQADAVMGNQKFTCSHLMFSHISLGCHKNNIFFFLQGSKITELYKNTTDCIMLSTFNPIWKGVKKKKFTVAASVRI